MTSAPLTEEERAGAFGRPSIYGLVLALLLVAGLARSWISTSRDSFQIDEAWHATAGASYARSGDYRLNPEHPPLVKLWVGVALPEARFVMPKFRPMADKEAERAFINEAVYRLNDPDVVQRRVRVAMLALNALLLVGVTLSVRRVFGAAVSLAALAVLVLDPSIVAHMPVVLTDLPLALLASIVFLQATVALRTFRVSDLALLSLALGLTLASKHSGLVPALGLALLGISWIWLGEPRDVRARCGRTGRLTAVFAGACVVLWAFYGFRFYESPGVDPSVVTFNRALEEKLADLSSSTQRAVLGLVVDGHLLPRAYVWGLADILRAGIEGRQDSLFVLGKLFQGITPWYTFPAVLLVKIPLGVSALAITGALLIVRCEVPVWRVAGLAWLGWAAFYLSFLVSGNSGYAGIRHALPVVIVAAVLAAVALAYAVNRAWGWWRAGGAVASLAAVVSARPRPRPWEYYNELVGGSAGAWRYFSDDGLDNSQRVRELAAYYASHVRGTEQRVYDYYGVAAEEAEKRGLVFSSLADDPSDSDVLTGTVFVNTRELSPRPTYDKRVFRDARPVARFGNLVVYQGEFRIPTLKAARLWARIDAAYTEDPPDLDAIVLLLEQVVALYPQDIQASFELGNLLLERGSPEKARAAYQRALEHVPPNNSIAGMLEQQVRELSRGELATVGPLRNPWLE